MIQNVDVSKFGSAFLFYPEGVFEELVEGKIAGSLPLMDDLQSASSAQRDAILLNSISASRAKFVATYPNRRKTLTFRWGI